MVGNAEKYIKVEVRCRHCGKLLFNILKKSIDKRNKSDIIVCRCNRCGLDNNIKI